ncbi:hypothetical protein A5892_18985 [Halotalea alkalilenta]|uniref:Uncharacterized protein n=1 Tax=Halotalea alkalilenta TaxID=376489 RepID=A0A172YJ76_9GAMM|nr:hypothetical protein A5892_18985 [Halotalea alkalilenta]
MIRFDEREARLGSLALAWRLWFDAFPALCEMTKIDEGPALHERAFKRRAFCPEDSGGGGLGGGMRTDAFRVRPAVAGHNEKGDPV